LAAKNCDYLESLGNGATFKEISKSIVSRVEISLPPLEEQKRIADILDRTQSLISKRKEAIAKLDTLTQSIFMEMFGDPVTNKTGFDEMGIENICDLIVDCVNRTAPVVDYPTNFKMIRTSNVKNGKVNLDAEVLNE
jgi:type I restriction enzyme S subunit